MAPRIYLDNNATTPLFPEVIDRLALEYQRSFANPGSAHSFGRDARKVLEDSREQIANCLDADPTEVIFTSGGTEAINMAVYGLTYGRKGTIALTAGEHPATRMAAERARQQGMTILTLDVDQNGRLKTEQLASLPWHDLRLVCVILAHNETGVIQDTQALAELCQQHRVPLLLDAVQAVGKIPVSFLKLKATALAFGAHKFHGPRGIGGLLLRRGVKLVPFLEGGHQEQGRRAGTEAVPLIAAMSTALEILHRDFLAASQHVQLLRDHLQSRLLSECALAVVHGIHANRLPNTLSIAFPGVSGEALLINLHLAEVACSLGSTCASGSAEPAPALVAMGLPREICLSSLRLTLSRMTTSTEVDEAADRIIRVVQRLR